MIRPLHSGRSLTLEECDYKEKYKDARTGNTMYVPITHERLRKVWQTQSWNLMFNSKTIEFVRSLNFMRHILNYETSGYEHAIFGKDIRRSPAVILFQELPYFSGK